MRSNRIFQLIVLLFCLAIWLFPRALEATNLDYGFVIHGNESIGDHLGEMNAVYGPGYNRKKVVRITLAWDRIIAENPFQSADGYWYWWQPPDIQNPPPGWQDGYQRDGMDGFIATLQQAGYEVMLVVAATPRWATTAELWDQVGSFAPPKNGLAGGTNGIDVYGDFIARTVWRYTRNRDYRDDPAHPVIDPAIFKPILHYQVSSEMNGHGWLRWHPSMAGAVAPRAGGCECTIHGKHPCGYAVTPEEYAELLRITWKRAKSVNEKVRIIFGGLANSGSWYLVGGPGDDPAGAIHYLNAIVPDSTDPIDVAGWKRHYFDIMASHTYAAWHNPFPDSVTSTGIRGNRWCYNGTTADTFAAFFRDLEFVREALDTNSMADKPIWITEFGYSSWDDDGYMASQVSTVDIDQGINSCGIYGTCEGERWVSQKVQRYFLIKALNMLEHATDPAIDFRVGLVERVYLYEFQDGHEVTDTRQLCGESGETAYVAVADDIDGLRNPDPFFAATDGWDPASLYPIDLGCVEREYAKDRELGFGITHRLSWLYPSRRKQAFRFLRSFLGPDGGWAREKAQCVNCTTIPQQTFAAGSDSIDIKIRLQNTGNRSVPWSRPEYFITYRVNQPGWPDWQRADMVVPDNQSLIELGGKATFYAHFDESTQQPYLTSPGVFMLKVRFMNSCGDMGTEDRIITIPFRLAAAGSR